MCLYKVHHVLFLALKTWKAFASSGRNVAMTFRRIRKFGLPKAWAKCVYTHQGRKKLRWKANTLVKKHYNSQEKPLLEPVYTEREGLDRDNVWMEWQCQRLSSVGLQVRGHKMRGNTEHLSRYYLCPKTFLQCPLRKPYPSWLQAAGDLTQVLAQGHKQWASEDSTDNVQNHSVPLQLSWFSMKGWTNSPSASICCSLLLPE